MNRLRWPITRVRFGRSRSTDLGHEGPTLLLTNQRHRSAAKLVQRYSQRMLIENNIEDGVSFFHRDALSSAVALKVNCDVQLTLMASSFYRYLGQRIGHGYEVVKSRHIFGDFIDATATLEDRRAQVHVIFQKRAHNPLLLAAGFDKIDVRVPWWGKRIQFVFGGASYGVKPPTKAWPPVASPPFL